MIVDAYANAPATIQTMTSPLQGPDASRYRFEADTSAGTFTLTPYGDSTDMRVFSYERIGPDLLSATGVWEGDTLRFTLRRFDETTFLLTSRGFRWVNEFPFNR